MITLDDELLNRIGLAELPAEFRPALLRGIYDELQIRVGMELASRMSYAQLDAFERLIDDSNEEGALVWLETNLPGYEEEVRVQFHALCAELTSLAAEICAVSALYHENSTAF